MIIMRSSRWRPILSLSVLIITITFFVYYFVSHPSVRQQLSRTSLPVIGLLLVLYFGTVGALAMINSATLRLCKINIDSSDSLLLTAYSSIINFFGPLQSGPAFRAVYLKKRYSLNLKNYTVATLVYYFFYGAFSGLFLLSGYIRSWLLALVVVSIVALLLISRDRRAKQRLAALDLHAWYYLALTTFLQVGLVCLIYFTELKSIAPGTSFSQAVIYTGAANLALFVSITPGAIGFREAFLLFSRHLHHIPASTIVAASILDRAMYIILLLIMALYIFGTHAQRQLKARMGS